MLYEPDFEKISFVAFPNTKIDLDETTKNIMIGFCKIPGVKIPGIDTDTVYLRSDGEIFVDRDPSAGIRGLYNLVNPFDKIEKGNFKRKIRSGKYTLDILVRGALLYEKICSNITGKIQSWEIVEEPLVRWKTVSSTYIKYCIEDVKSADTALNKFEAEIDSAYQAGKESFGHYMDHLSENLS